MGVVDSWHCMKTALEVYVWDSGIQDLLISVLSVTFKGS